MTILHRSSASLSASGSTTRLLSSEHADQKDYEAAFGSLVDTYGFGAPLPMPLPSSPLGGTCPPPPSPVHPARPWPSSSSAPLPRQSTSREAHSGAGAASLYSRLLALLKQRRDATKRLARRSAPNLGSLALASSTRKPAAQDTDGVDKLRRARGYEAAFIALQVEHGFIIGSSLPSTGSRTKV